jgi:hypothetical protein
MAAASGGLVVKARLSTFGAHGRNRKQVKPRGMDHPFIAGRAALRDAAELIERFGDDAAFEAAVRAEHSRDLENVRRYCYWRQIERVIASLSSDDVTGSIH